MSIQIANISKRFGPVQALDQVSLELEPGRVYGLLGNNGAGKTTLLNIITGRLFADSGSVLINGQPPTDSATLGQTYMITEKSLFPDDLRVGKSILLAAEFFPDFDRDYAFELAARFQLPLKTKIEKLSTGYRSIHQLVLALAVNTPILLLDEPVLGLDAQHRDLFYRLLMESCAQQPRTVIFSTHLIAEAAGLIERVIILHNGRILADADCDDLLSGGYTVSGPSGAVEAYLSGRDVISRTTLGGLTSACVQGQPAALPPGLELSRLELQDYFIQLMNKEDAGHAN